MTEDAASGFDAGSLPASSKVLLLEDDLLLAKCFGQVLSGLVVSEVLIAHTNISAIEIIGETDVAAAFIDVQLQFETSERTAHALAERDIPFAFVSGKPLSGALARSFPQAGLLTKPARREQLIEMLARLNCR